MMIIMHPLSHLYDSDGGCVGGGGVVAVGPMSREFSIYVMHLYCHVLSKICKFDMFVE